MFHHGSSRVGLLGLTVALPLLLPATSTAQGRTTITPYGNVYRAGGGRAPLGGFYSPFRTARTTITPFGNVYNAGPRYLNRFAYYPSFGLGYGGYYPGYGYPPSYGYGYYPTFGLYPSLFAGAGCLPYYAGAAPSTLGLSYGLSSPLFLGGAASPAVENRDLASEVATAPAQWNASTARIDVHVPDNAEVWIEGVKMKQTGPLRRFISPPLQPGQHYRYHVRATWTENGKPVTRTQDIPIEAGDTSSLAFLPSVAAPAAVAARVPADR